MTSATLTVDNLAHRAAETPFPLLSETVGGILRKHANNIGDRPAVYQIVDKQNDTLDCLSYSDLLVRAENCARWLAAETSPGDRVALWSQNTLESVILQFGSALAGTILTPFNTAWTPQEVDHAMTMTSPRILFVGNDHAGRALTERLSGDVQATVYPISKIKKIANEQSEQTLPDVKQDDPCLIQFTSGTTGKAKGALLSHRACLIGGWLRPHTEGATEQDVWLNGVPFHHIGGTCAVVLGAVGVGGSFVVLESYDRAQLTRLMPIVKATRMGGVPTMWHDILGTPDLPKYSTLKSVSLGGASVSVDLAKNIYERLGARCGIGYGQSEFPIISATMPDDPIEIACETVGRPLPHIEMKITDPKTGNTMKLGETGEICLRGPTCMDGYWGNPKATAETIDSQGFLHTGDMGSLDKDGYCRINGRLRELIIRGGENIYPAEIEGVLLAHPAIAMAAAVGVDDSRLGQEVGAVITLRPDYEIATSELELYVGKSLSSYKIPRHWREIKEMPLTASGKIRKVELEKLFK